MGSSNYNLVPFQINDRYFYTVGHINHKKETNENYF